MTDGFKYTPARLKKIEAVLECAGYKLLYEKGSFRPGSCVIEERKVVVVNRHLDLEGRTNSLIDIISSMEIDNTSLPENLRALHDRICLQKATA